MYTAIVRAARRCVVDCPPASVGTAVADCCYLCWLLPNRVHGLVQDEVARCNSFEIHSAWSVCTAVRTVLCKDARQMRAAVDSGCDENAQLMCELSNYGVCRLQRKSWHCGDARVMDVLLGLMHAGDGAANHTFRFVRWSGGISVNCQRQISHNEDLNEAALRRTHSRVVEPAVWR